MAAHVNVLSTRRYDRLPEVFDTTRCRPVDPLRKFTTTWDYIASHLAQRIMNALPHSTATEKPDLLCR